MGPKTFESGVRGEGSKLLMCENYMQFGIFFPPNSNYLSFFGRDDDLKHQIMFDVDVLFHECGGAQPISI